METAIVSILVPFSDPIGMAKACDEFLIGSIKLATDSSAADELREIAMQELADRMAHFYQPVSKKLRAEVSEQALQWLHDTDDWHGCYSTRSAAMLWGGPTCAQSTEHVQSKKTKKRCKNCSYWSEINEVHTDDGFCTWLTSSDGNPPITYPSFGCRAFKKHEEE